MNRLPFLIPKTGPFSIQWCEMVAEDIIKKTDAIQITPNNPTIYFGLDHEKLHKDVQEFLDMVHKPGLKSCLAVNSAYDKLYRECKKNGRVEGLLITKDEFTPKEEQIISGF